VIRLLAASSFHSTSVSETFSSYDDSSPSAIIAATAGPQKLFVAL
jgi:hypothetical protein